MPPKSKQSLLLVRSRHTLRRGRLGHVPCDFGRLRTCRRSGGRVRAASSRAGLRPPLSKPAMSLSGPRSFTPLRPVGVRPALTRRASCLARPAGGGSTASFQSSRRLGARRTPPGPEGPASSAARLTIATVPARAAAASCPVVASARGDADLTPLAHSSQPATRLAVRHKLQRTDARTDTGERSPRRNVVTCR